MGADPRFYERLGPLSARALAETAGAELIGDGDAPVSDVSAPEDARAEDLFFLAEGRAVGAAAGVAILADRDAAEALAARNRAALLHGSPKAAFALAAPRLLRPRPHEGEAMIHPDARIAAGASIGPGCMIGPDAEIADGVRLEPGAVIGAGVGVGAGSRIGARAVVAFALVGERVDIGAGAVIGERGFGLAQSGRDLYSLPHLGRVVIEDDVTLGANVTVDRGMFDDTLLKAGCRIDNLCHVAHNVVVGERAVMAAFAGLSGSVRVGAGAQFGGRVGVADHLSIGEGARLAADAAVMRDVPAGETWAGSPAQPISRFMRETAWLRRAAGKRAARAKPDASET